MDVTKNRDISRLLAVTRDSKNYQQLLEQIKTNSNAFSVNTVLLDTPWSDEVLELKTRTPQLIIHLYSLNHVHDLDRFLSCTNFCLDNGAYIACHCTTAAMRRKKIMRRFPAFLSYFLCLADYCCNRVMPKLAFTRELYYWCTRGQLHVLTRVEMLGRLYRAGFELVHEEVTQDEYYVIATKVKEPVCNDKPSNGVLIRLKRRGKGGKMIEVYKLRTMYAYSEYLQPYIYQQEGLCAGGKIARDYRVNFVGKFLRKTWLDELPMIVNWIKGDLKLVGVRPLSEHYFGLYSKELQELRTQTKPGLLPPFYADMPETLAEIQESEMRYLKSYMENPFRTDWCYFWKAVGNIVLKGKRSR